MAKAFQPPAGPMQDSPAWRKWAWDISTILNPDLLINNQTGTSYTLTLSDAEKYIRLNNGSAVTLNVPNDSVVNFDIGTQIHIRQVGAGQVIITPATGVTITTSHSAAKTLRTQNSTCSIVKVDKNSWELFGDLT